MNGDVILNRRMFLDRTVFIIALIRRFAGCWLSRSQGEILSKKIKKSVFAP